MVVIQTPDKNILRKQLQAGYEANAAENLKIAGIWSFLEAEASQRIEDLSISVGLAEL